MKKNTLTIIFAALFGITFNACDKIEEPYITPTNETIATVTFPPLDPSTVFRKVLIEEYTGHCCSNCPVGHQKLEELHGIFGDTLVPVSIHATTLANPIPSLMPYDFRTQTGNELAEYYNISRLPTAIINRQMNAGDLEIEQWQTKINEVNRDTAYAAIQMINEYNTHQTKKLQINTKITMLQNWPSPLHISLFLVEDSIIKPQISNNMETVSEYVHNHVLRDGINGTFGALLHGNGILTKDSTYTYGYVLDFSDKDWNPEHCSVVAILYDKDNHEVLQVEQVPVK